MAISEKMTRTAGSYRWKDQSPPPGLPVEWHVERTTRLTDTQPDSWKWAGHLLICFLSTPAWLLGSLSICFSLHHSLSFYLPFRLSHAVSSFLFHTYGLSHRLAAEGWIAAPGETSTLRSLSARTKPSSMFFVSVWLVSSEPVLLICQWIFSPQLRWWTSPLERIYTSGTKWVCVWVDGLSLRGEGFGIEPPLLVVQTSHRDEFSGMSYWATTMRSGEIIHLMWIQCLWIWI